MIVQYNVMKVFVSLFFTLIYSKPIRKIVMFDSEVLISPSMVLIVYFSLLEEFFYYVTDEG